MHLWNLGRVFNSRLRRACIWLAIAWITKRPNLKLKTQPEQLIGSLPIAFMLPGTLQQLVHGIKLTRTFFLIPLMVIRWLLNDSNIVWPVKNDIKLFSCIHMGTKLAIQVQEVDLKKLFCASLLTLFESLIFSQNIYETCQKCEWIQGLTHIF